MTENIFELKVDLLRNIPFALDAVFEIGIGVIMVFRREPDTTLLVIGWGLIVIGLIQLVREIKTFHLTANELMVKRPLFPFSLAEHRFPIAKLKEVKFIRIKGRFGGPHLNVMTTDSAESFRIEGSKNKIDEFENKLRSLGVFPIRDGM